MATTLDGSMKRGGRKKQMDSRCASYRKARSCDSLAATPVLTAIGCHGKYQPLGSVCPMGPSTLGEIDIPKAIPVSVEKDKELS